MKNAAEPTRPRTRLPHVLATLFGLAIVFVSLEPFSPWLPPPPGTPFFLFAPTPARWLRYDTLLNVLAYVPFGLFVALLRRGATPAQRVLDAAIIGAAMSFAMESLQMYVPPRVASAMDLAANAIGAALGGLAAAALARSNARDTIYRARARLILPGYLGDIGLALLLLWLVAQTNPGIPLFAVTFDSDPVAPAAIAAVPPSPPIALAQPPAPDVSEAAHEKTDAGVQAAGAGFQMLGVGLFTALLLRRHRRTGTIVLALIAGALAVKSIAALILLKPAVWESWLRPGTLIGIAAGAVALRIALALPRPVQVAACAVALLSSLGAPVLAPELLTARAPLALFDWHHGQLLNFNGLTRTALLVWPILTAAWLFVLAGRPAWGKPAEPA
ncbi:MAG TPA: VanZ family protein [Casimicrobiaceae bacterium]|nr:VanZ family protein [Casimicrobiaceae bacterium]